MLVVDFGSATWLARRTSFFKNYGGFDTRQDAFGLPQTLRERPGRHHVAVVVRPTSLLAQTVKDANGGVINGQGVREALDRGLVVPWPACGRPEAVDQEADTRSQPSFGGSSTPRRGRTSS